MLPQDFKPSFDASFYVYEEDPATKAPIFLSGIDSRYCLAETSAQEFVKVLAAGSPAITATVVDDWPKGILGGPFKQSGMVPWLKITDGLSTIQVNAGLMANYYNHATPDTGLPLAPEQVAAIQNYYDGRCRADILSQLAAAKAGASQ